MEGSNGCSQSKKVRAFCFQSSGRIWKRKAWLHEDDEKTKERFGSVTLSRLTQFQLDWRFWGPPHCSGGMVFRGVMRTGNDQWEAWRIRRYRFSEFSPQFQCNSIVTVSCKRSFLSGIWTRVFLILSFALGVTPYLQRPASGLMISSMTAKSCQLKWFSQKP